MTIELATRPWLAGSRVQAGIVLIAGAVFASCGTLTYLLLYDSKITEIIFALPASGAAVVLVAMAFLIARTSEPRVWKPVWLGSIAFSPAFGLIVAYALDDPHHTDGYDDPWTRLYAATLRTVIFAAMAFAYAVAIITALWGAVRLIRRAR